MRFPLALTTKIAAYIITQKLRRTDKFATVLQLEPLHTCNLTCTGCGRIREYSTSLKDVLPLEDCLAAANEWAIVSDAAVTYRDVALDPAGRTITLRRPLLLDLGAVAKGLAIDLAARELSPLNDFAIDAGGDLCVAGYNAAGQPWSIGIRHPREDRQLIERVPSLKYGHLHIHAGITNGATAAMRAGDTSSIRDAEISPWAWPARR